MSQEEVEGVDQFRPRLLGRWQAVREASAAFEVQKPAQCTTDDARGVSPIGAGDVVADQDGVGHLNDAACGVCVDGGLPCTPLQGRPPAWVVGRVFTVRGRETHQRILLRATGYGVADIRCEFTEGQGGNAIP